MNTAKKLSIRLEAVGGDKVRQEFKNIGSDGQKAFQRITQVITPANDNLKVLDNTAKAFNNTLKQAASLAGAYLGLRGLTSAFKGIVQTNKEFESLIGSLKTVTGSAKGAQEAFSMIEKFALDTPYQLEEIIEAFTRLKALGLDATSEALTSYGNTASAFGKNILDFTSAVSSAVMLNFKSLRTFGIQTQVEGDKVRFTFQGITTTVGKSAQEIEAYLKSIGLVNFGGAMKEQMDTMGGAMSNIEDAISKLIRSIGENGLNKALKDTFSQFNELLDSSDGAAKAIGQALATAVNVASKAFFTLAKYIEPIITLLTVRLGASLITKGIDLLKASVYALNVALMGTGTAGASATLGLKMMWQVSKVAAVQMYATAVAAKVLAGAVGLLKGIMALLGGPAGLVMLVVYGLYKLVDSHNVAKRAANDHADTLAKLKEQMAETVKETNNLVTAQSKNQAIAEWSYKLKVAEKNIKDLKEELKDTGGLSFFQRHAPNMFLKEYQIFANDLADILSQSKYNLEEYQKEVWRLAAEYPDFQPQAKAIQEKFLLLKAAEIDAQKARDELKYIQNPELRPKEEKPAVPKPPVLPKTDTSAYEKTIEDIKQKVFELQDPYDQAMQKAAKWRDDALKNLDKTKAGYEDFKNDVNRVYDDMVKKAGEAALQSSKDWKDGVTRGMKSVYEDASDMASMTENLVKNSFKSMEDTLTNFVMTGKANFADFVNSVVEGMVRMAMQYAVIKPIMGGVMGYFGIPTAHTGGVIGTDTLSTKAVSPSVFENAPRFHTGGLVGGEIPIIAKKGETVFTPGQMKALGAELNSKPPVYVNVNVVNKASGTRTTANPTRDMNGNVNLDIIVEQIEGAIGKNISKGEGLSPILEQRYALNPAYGSYR